MLGTDVCDGRRSAHAGPGRSQRGYTAGRLQLIPRTHIIKPHGTRN